LLIVLLQLLLTILTKKKATPETETGVTHELNEDKIENKKHSVPDDERSKTSVVASMLAAGYVLGSDAITKARDIDEQNQISLKAAAAAAAVKAKALEIDQQLKISETLGNIGSTIAAKAQEVDQSYHVTDNINYALKSVSDGIGAGVARAKESPALQSTSQTLSNLADQVGGFIAPSVGAIKANVEDIKQQTNQSIAEKQAKVETPAGTPPPIPPKNP